MRKIPRYISALALLLPLVVPLLTPVATAVENPSIQVLRIRDSTVSSSNWSGYVDFTGGTGFTNVTGTFTVTTVSGSAGTYSSHWTGIGGFAINDKTLIQAGFDEDVDSNGKPRYWSWYELLPAAATPICGSSLTCSSYNITAGDVITVTIRQTGVVNKKQIWSISVADATVSTTLHSSWTFTISVQYNSKLASAEWISERPRVGGTISLLANFGNRTFTNGQTRYRGTLYDIASLPNYQVNMVNSVGNVLAQPGALSGGAFVVTWKASG